MNNSQFRILSAVFLLLGLVGGWLFDRFEDTGALVDWVQLPTVESAQTELKGVDGRGVYLIDRQGLLVYCEMGESGCRASEKLPFRFEETHGPCDYSSAAYSIFSNDPDNIDECVQSYVIYADAVATSIGVKTDTGELWLWDYLYGTFLQEEAQLVRSLCLGALLGLVVVRIAYWTTRRRETAQ